MFLPQLTLALTRLALALAFLAAGSDLARAETPPQRLVLHATTTAGASGNSAAHTDAMLASLSAEAGIPFFTAAEAARHHPPSGDAAQTPPDPALCLRAGFGLSPAVMAGSQMDVQHAIIGCHTETAGLPISVSQDPALQPPPTSRTGEYTLDLTLRYRLLRRKRVEVEASLTDQGLAYSIDSPISGNNLVAAMSVRF